MNDFELHRGDVGINITLIIHFTNIYINVTFGKDEMDAQLLRVILYN